MKIWFFFPFFLKREREEEEEEKVKKRQSSNIENYFEKVRENSLAKTETNKIEMEKED